MKTVLITGASSGIGLAIANKLSAEGYCVYGIGRSFDETKDYPEEFHRFSCDLTNETDRSALLRQLKENFHLIAPDILIHGAGVGYYGLCETIDETDLSAMVRTNLEVPVLLTTHYLPFMKQRGSGHIIFLSSVTAKKTNTYGCAYGATKSGLLSFANSLFEEVRKHGIKVSSVLPDMTQTNLYRNADFTADETACLFAEDIADTVSFLLSRGSHMNVTELTLQPQKHRIKKKEEPKGDG